MEISNKFPDGWKEFLAATARRGLPLICANPAFKRVNGEGCVLIAPGEVARFYEGLGGISHYHGKPVPRIFANALNITADRVLAIGDSLLHDIPRGNMSGSTVFSS
jgi:ribonucleotide monophosphatase NagD (HAD superfamily)